jgi:hypothetical protein
MKLNELLKEEESTVGRYNNYIITVYKEPLLNPSFHIRTKNNETECAYQIKDFKLLEQKTKNVFSNKELTEIKEWLLHQSNNPDFKGKTNWEVLLILWNASNPEHRVNSKIKMA